MTVYRYLTWECSGLARSDEWKNDQDLALAQMSISKLITCAYEATSLLYDLGEFLYPCQFLDPAAMKIWTVEDCVALDPHRWMSAPVLPSHLYIVLNILHGRHLVPGNKVPSL